MDRRALATFLRSRRERLTPAAVGLPADGPRRTPGLRREEVARLAYISVAYYVRLEQARGPRPSRRVLSALHRALRLTDNERAHLFELAGESVGPPGPSRNVPTSIIDLLGRMPETAAVVVDAKYDVLAWNPLAAALLQDFSALPLRDRNLIRQYFLRTDSGPAHYGMGDDFGRFAAGHLRIAAGRYPTDPAIRDLVSELLTSSDEFRRLWELELVETQHHRTKSVHHPVVGPLELFCDVLTIPDRDQHLVLLTAEPASPSEQALRLLAVIGIQSMDVHPKGQLLNERQQQSSPTRRYSRDPHRPNSS
jgi:transcriptional regulator with XRE-family HTH domain